VTSDHLDELKVGSSFKLPISAFSAERKLSESYARKWGPLIAQSRARRQGADAPVADRPVIFKLEKNAQALNISQLVAERNAEWLTRGEFLITDVAKEDDLTVVTVKQGRTVSKALAGTDVPRQRGSWDPQLHPRAQGGRFGDKPRTKVIDVDQEFDQIISQLPATPVRHITYATPPVAPAKPDTETDQKFESLIAAQPKHSQGFTSTWTSPFQRAEVREEQMVAFAVDLAVELRQKTNVWTEARAKTNVWTGTKTKPIEVIHGSLGKLHLQDGDLSKPIRLDPGIDFSTDAISMAAITAGDILEQKERAIDDMKEMDGALTTYDVNGNRFDTELNDEEMEQVANWFATSSIRRHEPDYDPNFTNEESLNLTWQDAQGNEMGKSLSYAEIGENFGLAPSTFEHYVVSLDEVPTEEGAVVRTAGSDQSRHRQYELAGDYEQVPGTVDRIVDEDTGFAVTTFKVRPVDAPREGE
jgi:hypothetical protein